MTRTSRPSVAVLGGGMAALTAALELSEGDWRERFDAITVYQRGWRLGGKGASSRGAHGRIEEHGLHVLLGYYDHTFDVLRRVYDELDRTTRDPHCPIRTFEDAVAPSNVAGVVDAYGGKWSPWVARFGSTPGRPGDRSRARPSGEAFGGAKPGAAGGAGSSRFPLTLPDAAVASVALLLDFFDSLAPVRGSKGAG
ncbi:MAG: NAD(P)-binding protein, partial [Acidimicrobiales bacterium]